MAEGDAVKKRFTVMNCVAPKVSVVIPVYKTEKYLRVCLNSVSSQSLQDIEIICVDDCSPDSSPAILDGYAQKDSRLKVIHLPENHGAFYVRRTGMLATHGKYVMFLDSDDFYEHNACQKALELIETSHCDMVNFGTALWIGDKIIRDPNYLTPKFKRIDARNLLQACYVQELFTHTMWDKIYDGEIIRKAATLMTEERIPGMEDYVQFFMIASMMKTALAAPQDILIRYRTGIGDMSNLNHTMQTIHSAPYAEKWLKTMPNADIEDFKALDIMKMRMRNCVLRKILEAEKLDEKILKKIGECCGVEMLVDFIKATGLLAIPHHPRFNICERLLLQLQQKNQEIERLKNPHPTYSFR